MSKTKFGVTRLYTKQEVAEILRVSLRTVSKYISCCGLPHRKIGGTVRIPKDKLLKWLAKEGRC